MLKQKKKKKLLHKTINKKQRLSHMRSSAHEHFDNEKKKKEENSIFVVLTMYRAVKPAKILIDLFQKADNPNRVFVGVVEHQLERVPSALEQCYAALEKHHVAIPLKNIRFRRMPVATTFGAALARRECITQLYQNEKFIFFLHEHSVLSHGWDRILLTSLTVAHNEGGQVVSQVPRLVSHKKNKKDVTTTTFPAFGGFLEASSEKRRQNPLFIPTFFGKPVHPRGPIKPFQVAVASYKCLFSTAEVYLRRLAMWEHALPFLQSDAADMLLSIELWTRGLHVYVPCESVLTHRGAHGDNMSSCDDVVNRQVKKVTRYVLLQVVHDLLQPAPKEAVYIQKLRKGAILPVPAFFDWIGVDAAAGDFAGRAPLGILSVKAEDQEPEYEEIVLKCGTIQNYQKLRHSRF